MEFNKYSCVKSGGSGTVTIGSQNSISSNHSSSSNSSSSSSASLDRMLWGNNDDGGDLDDTLFINGSIYLNGYDYSDDEEDEDKEKTDKEYTYDEDDEGGNLYGNKVKVNDVVTKDLVSDNAEINEDLTVNRHLYVYMKHDGEVKSDKKCILDIIQENSNDIADLQKDVADNALNIANNSTEITNIKNELNGLGGITEERLMEILNLWKYGDDKRPVVLAAGHLRFDGYKWVFDGISLDCFILSSFIPVDGLMTIGFDNQEVVYGKNTFNKVTAVHCTQVRSAKTGDEVEDKTYIVSRSDGAHWFETRFKNESRKIYIREFREANDDNDTWASTSWSGEGTGLREVAITVYGYAYFITK